MGLAVGGALDIADVAKASIEFFTGNTVDFRDRISNEKDNSFEIKEISAECQIENHGGLTKNYIWEMKTPEDKHGILFGIHSDSYVRSTAFYNYTDDKDKWDALFTGKMQMDIVKANKSNSNLRKLVTVESNVITRQIIGNERRVIAEGQTQDIYALRNKDVCLEFVAPLEGIYTFETLGSVRNVFHADKGDISNKTDTYNQTLKVRLKKGELFKFSTQNISDSLGKYKIAATFTPPELVLGKKMSINVSPNDTEFLVFKCQGLKPYTISINSSGITDFVLHDKTASNEYKTFYHDNNITTSYYSEDSSSLYISFKNTDASKLSVDIVINEAQNIVFGENVSVDFDNNIIFTINSLIGSKYDISAVTACKTDSILYDHEMKVVNISALSKQHSLHALMNTDSVYYIKFLNYETTKDNVNLSVEYKPDNLIFGYQVIQKTFDSSLYHFRTTAEANYSIIATANTLVNVYNSNGVQVNSINGYYYLAQDADYYVVVQGNTQTISIGIESTDDSTGELPSNGFVFVRFIPSIDYKYSIKSNLTYKFYDSLLNETNNLELKTGQVYYLRLSGSNGQNYSVDFDLDVAELGTDVYQIVKSGYYKFKLDANTPVTFKIYTSDGKPISIAYGINVNNINTEIKKDTIINMVTGTYYLKLQVSSTTALVILTENHKEANKTVISLGTKIIKKFDANEVHFFEFNNNNGNQTFHFLRKQVPLSCEIQIYKKGTNTLIPFTSSEKYWEFQLDNGDYTITFICRTDFTVYNAEIEIYIPTKFNSVKFNNVEATLTNSKISLIMGVNYRLTFNNVGTHPITVEIDRQVISDNYTFAVKKESYTVNVLIYDDYGLNIINVETIFPYAVTADMINYIYTVNINPITNYQVQNYKIKEIDIFSDNKLVAHSSAKMSVDLARVMLFGNGKKINGIVRIEIAGNLFNLEVQEMDFINKEIMLKDLVGNESPRLYVNAKAAGETGRVISINSKVKAIFIIGEANVAHNVQFKFPNNKSSEEILFYTEKFLNVRNLNSAIIGPNTNLNWVNEGTTTIKGMGQYVVELNRLRLQQSSNSNVIIEGIGYNGTSGAYLHDTLYANGGSLTITGGKGASGTNGTQPPDAVTGPNVSSPGTKGATGGNGTNGSRGGHGLIVTNNFTSNSINLTCVGGMGGQGGAGGTGGKASSPNNGRDSNGVYLATKGPRGGDGGTGGNGGFGGIGGNALVVLNLSSTTAYSGVACIAGKGGKGGTGGNGGAATRGGNGGSDHWILSDKGDCHCGGDGGNGGDSGRAGRGGYNGVQISKTLDNYGSLSNNNGDFGKGGAAGEAGSLGSAGAGGSPNKCEKGTHLPGRSGKPGKVIMIIYR